MDRESFRLGALARRSAILTLAVLLIAPRPADAQFLKTNRRWIFALVGAAVVGIPAAALTESKDSGSDVACSSKACVGALTGGIGALIGFLVGAEMDSRYSRRMAAGPSLDYEFRDVPLGMTPDRMAPFPGGAAVIGVRGARIVGRDGTVRERGAGVRGIEDVEVLPQKDLLVLSTFANLLSFSLQHDTVQGQVIDQRGGGSMAAFEERLAVAGQDSLRLLSLDRVDGSVTVETVSGRQNASYVTDMTFSRFGRTGWILMEDRLASVKADLTVLGELQLPAVGRSLNAAGERLLVSAGSDGVWVIDGRNPTEPKIVLSYTGVKFAYAAALQDDTLYVAAGPEGVAVVDISGAEPRILGVARESQFAVDVSVVGDGEIWILDRGGRSVQIASFGASAATSSSSGR
jgi:hypothetical protein